MLLIKRQILPKASNDFLHLIQFALRDMMVRPVTLVRLENTKQEQVQGIVLLVEPVKQLKLLVPQILHYVVGILVSAFHLK